MVPVGVALECPGTKPFSTCHGKRAKDACRTGLGLE